MRQIVRTTILALATLSANIVKADIIQAPTCCTYATNGSVTGSDVEFGLGADQHTAIMILQNNLQNEYITAFYFNLIENNSLRLQSSPTEYVGTSIQRSLVTIAGRQYNTIMTMGSFPSSEQGIRPNDFEVMIFELSNVPTGDKFIDETYAIAARDLDDSTRYLSNAPDTASQVPEPSTLAQLIIGLISLAVYVKRQR